MVRENAYRDVWLLLITGAVLYSLILFQNERWNNVYNACQSSNERFLATKAKLDEIIDRAPPANRKQAEMSRKTTLEFVATIVPTHFDRHGRSTCRAYADRQVSRFP